MLGIQDLYELGFNAPKAPRLPASSGSVILSLGQWLLVSPGSLWQRRAGGKEAGGLAGRPRAQGPGAGLHQRCPTLPGQPEGW